MWARVQRGKKSEENQNGYVHEFSFRGIILAKEQLGLFHTFWTMPIMIFSPVQSQILVTSLYELEIVKNSAL